jgi:hypothetical protein
MQMKVWLTRAGIAALSDSLPMSDPEWAWFIFDRFPSSAVEANEKGCCPQCGRQPVEAMSGMFLEEPAETPDRVEGWVYVLSLSGLVSLPRRGIRERERAHRECCRSRGRIADRAC